MTTACALAQLQALAEVKRRHSGGKVMTPDLPTQVIDYKTVFRQFPGTAFVMTPSFEILDASDEIRELIGREPRDLVEDPGRPGVFEERFWSGVTTPIPGDDGRTAVIVFWGHDTTPIVNQLWAQAAALG
jgi:hypothetical protein